MLEVLLNETQPPTELQQAQDLAMAQISFHALMGHSVLQTIRLMGRIGNSPVNILVDGGSTHNFIQDRVAKKLGLPLQQADSFNVLVGNGEELPCCQLCHQIHVQIEPHLFLVDLYVLPLSGAELVLGVEWLKSLGPVLTDYNPLTLSFLHEGQVVQLQGVSKPGPKEASLHQLKRLVSTQAIDTMLQLHLIEPAPHSHTSDDKPEWLTPLLQRFEPLFSEPKSLPPPRSTDHHIPLLEGANPVNVRPYRYPHFQKQEIESQIKEMLSQGIIQHSSSAFSSPVLLVRKKDGTWRFCVDYRALNALTTKDRFPILAIEEPLDELYGTRWFSKLDLRSGFNQIRMHPGDISKTAFRTHQGHYEFLVMPFGLCNAPSTFQTTMNFIFQPYLRDFVIVFFDDILVYSQTLDDHHQHLEIVFKCLLDHQLFLKQSKCSFVQPSISYLGHIVSVEGVGPDPEKIQAMLNWPAPKTVKQLCGFLGLTVFYRKFVKHYASIASPLTELLKKEAFNWSPAAQ